LLGLLCALPVSAGTYYSPAGDFGIEYPDEWYQVDYNTVDFHLKRTYATEDALNYDAVFSVSSSVPFFETVYLILTIDTSESMTEQMIDSVLKSMESTFGEEVTYKSLEEFFADTTSNVPVYDRDQQLLTVLLDVDDGTDARGQLSLLAIRFYEGGTANFYFYAPDSLFEAHTNEFISIIGSFTTDDVNQSGTQADVKVADLEEVRKRAEARKQSDSRLMLYGGVFIVLLIIILAARKRKRSA
jgi:hypothetical protein